MSKVTSKLQVTIPKAVAEQYGIAPGDDVEFVPAGDTIRVVPAAATARRADATRRLELFDHATRRQRARERASTTRLTPTRPSNRDWTRDDLYTRGRAR
jgi:AbrB family looped-hinge helix DNA binding protein